MLLVAWPEGRPFTSEHFASLVHELREDLMRRVQVPETRFYWKLMIGHERFYIETAFSLMLAPPEGHDGYGGERAAPADPAHVRIVYYPMIKLQLSEASYHVRSPYSDLTLEQLDERSVWTSSNEHLFVHRLHSWSLEFGREEGLLTWETDAGPVRISFGEEGPEVESAFSVEVFSMERSWENRIPAFRIQRLFRPGDDRGYLLEPVPADHRPDPWEHIIWANPRTVEHCAEALGLTAEQAFVLAEEWIECAAAYSIQTAGVLPPNITRSGEYGLPVLHHSMATEVCRDWPYCERDERGLAHFGLSGQRLVRIPGCTP